MDCLSARSRPHNNVGLKKGQATISRNASISQVGFEPTVQAVEYILESSTLQMSYIDIYVFEFFGALLFFLCFTKIKFVLFVRTIALRIRTEISDFHWVIPCPNRKTRWQTGARSFHNLEADLTMNLLLANFNVLLTVHLSITLVNDQLDSQLFYFIVRLLQSSTCFEQRRAHHQEFKLY